MRHPAFRRVAFPADSRRGGGFTLIELLVVIAIISLLVSILLPSLSRAKALAKRVVCATNIHGSGAGCMMYAQDFNGILPSLGHYQPSPEGVDTACGVDGTTANLYYWGTRIPPGMNLNEVMQPYTPGMLTWVCPATSSPPPDHEVSDGAGAKNNRSSCYFSFMYLPKRKLPDFGQGPKYLIPAELAKAKSSQVLLQDPMRSYEGTSYSDQGWNANHGSGGHETFPDDANGINPSGEMYYNIEKNGDLGGNLGFYDGSVQWYVWEDLTNLGPDKAIPTAFFYSVLP
ncbi:MAG: type II secretion system protein [Phycisphaerae bacterium]|nr:type II secretion system protein [Phycisphaerae bacterium]